MKYYLERIGSVLFIAVIAIFCLFIASDFFGVVMLSREAGHLILMSVLITLPSSLLIFGVLNWFFESKQQIFYLKGVAAPNLLMAAIIYLVMNSGI